MLLSNLSAIFVIKTTKVIAVVEMESLFSTPMPSFLETPSRIQSADQNEITEIAYEIMEHFVTDFQEFKASNAEKIDKIERLSWENIMGHETVQTKYIKQQVQLLKMKLIDLGWNQNPYSK